MEAVEDVMGNIGKYLLSYKTRNKLNNSEMAKSIGVSVSRYRQLENGDKESISGASLKILISIAKLESKYLSNFLQNLSKEATSPDEKESSNWGILLLSLIRGKENDLKNLIELAHSKDLSDKEKLFKSLSIADLVLDVQDINKIFSVEIDLLEFLSENNSNDRDKFKKKLRSAVKKKYF